MRIQNINFFSLTAPFQLIKHLMRTKIHQLFHRNDAPNYANQDILLVLNASNDANGALSLPRPFLNPAMKNHGKVIVVRKTVSSIDDIIKEINALKNQQACIRGVWINAHASKNTIELGSEYEKNGIITNAKVKNQKNKESQPVEPNAYQLKEALNQIDKDGVIVLDSCKAGRIIENGGPSIAQTIADLAPGRIVYASIKAISSCSPHITWKKSIIPSEKDQLEVNFTVSKQSSRTGLLGLILDISYTYLYALGIFKEEVTAKFKNCPLPQERNALL